MNWIVFFSLFLKICNFLYEMALPSEWIKFSAYLQVSIHFWIKEFLITDYITFISNISDSFPSIPSCTRICGLRKHSLKQTALYSWIIPINILDDKRYLCLISIVLLNDIVEIYFTCIFIDEFTQLYNKLQVFNNTS